jgi:hypothetical protein
MTEARGKLLALQKRANVKGTAPIRIFSFVLWAACGALCQNISSPDLPHRLGIGDWEALPDAPSASRAQALGSAAVLRMPESRNVTDGSQPSCSEYFPVTFLQRTSCALPGEHPQYVKRNLLYSPSTGGAFLDRGSHAVPSILVSRNGSGKIRLNASSVLGVLTAVAAQATSHPASPRSNSATFNNAGYASGRHDGPDVYDEVGTSIRQLMKSFTPKFVSGIQGRITHVSAPRDVASIPAK